MESSQPSPSASISQQDVRNAVLRALATLPADEAGAISLRLGLGDAGSYKSGEGTSSAKSVEAMKVCGCSIAELRITLYSFFTHPCPV